MLAQVGRQSTTAASTGSVVAGGGRAAAEEDVPPTQLLSTNAEFQHFLSSQCALPPYLSSLCDAASSGIGTRSLPAAAEGLREALVQVERQLRTIVSLHHTELLGEVQVVRGLEKRLESVTSRVDELVAGVGEVKDALGAKYKEACRVATELKNIQSAASMLRTIQQFLQKARKLRECTSNKQHQNLAKAAELILELKRIRSSVDLTGVEVVDNEMRFVLGAEKSVIQEADTLLKRGVESEDQPSLGMALQVFYKMRLLTSKVSELVSSASVRAESQINATFAPILEREDTSPSPTEQIHLRLQLRENLSALIDILSQTAKQVWFTQRVLGKMHIPSSLYSTLRQYVEQELAAQKGGAEEKGAIIMYWRHVCTALGKALRRCVMPKGISEWVVVSEYLKVLELLTKLLHGLQAHCEIHHDVTRRDRDKEDFVFAEEIVRDALEPLTQRYLSDASHRILQTVNASLPPSGAQNFTSEHAADVVKAIAKEIEAVRSVDGPLLQSVAERARDAMLIVSKRSNALVDRSPAARHFEEQISTGQALNASVYRGLYTFSEEINNTVIRALLGPNVNTMSNTSMIRSSANAVARAREILEEGEKFVSMNANGIVEPIFQGLRNMIERALESLASDPRYAADNTDPMDGSQSPCVKILSKHLRTVESTFLPLFSRNAQISSNLFGLMQRTLESGKALLMGDMADIVSKTQLLAGVDRLVLGGSAKNGNIEGKRSASSFRAFQLLLFMDLDEISAQYVPKREREQGEDEDEEKRNGDEDQQHSHMNSIDLLHHLYSRGPPELASPHTVEGWSLKKYSQFLDAQEKEAVFGLISRSLDAYENRVNSKGEMSFHPVYPVMKQLLEAFRREQ